MASEPFLLYLLCNQIIMRNWNFTKGFKIYYNLHKKCFSVQAWDIDKKGWRLYLHAAQLEALDIKMKISEVGRQRVIREGRKNVHAFIYAKSISPICPTAAQQAIGREYTRRCSYNPYRVGHFFDKETEEPVHSLDKALLHEAGCMY